MFVISTKGQIRLFLWLWSKARNRRVSWGQLSSRTLWIQ